jgi:hypothetical protein
MGLALSTSLTHLTFLLFLIRNEGFQFKAAKDEFILIRVLDFDYGKQGANERYSKRGKQKEGRGMGDEWEQRQSEIGTHSEEGSYLQPLAVIDRQSWD